MASQTSSRITPEEYLAIERKADHRSEYLDGEIFAMSGASERHNLIVGNVFAQLHAQLKNRPCKVYSNDMRVKVGATGLYTYPDVVALCAEARFDDEQRDTLLNPAVIVEVLSQSIEAYDRGQKFGHYRKLESVTEYLLISQDTLHVEHYVRRADNQWLLSEASDLQESIHMSSLNCVLKLADVYDKVDIVRE